MRIALNLKGLKAEQLFVHLVNNGGEQHSGVYRQVNPSELASTLTEGDFTIGQSLSIIEYLDEKFNDTALLPQDLQQNDQV